MYRDDTAARSHLVLLERQVRARRSARVTLTRYRNALVGELQRLQHAVVWYTNGETYGFNELAARDDLSPARREGVPLAADALEAEIFAMSRELVAARTAALLRELAHQDPDSELLQRQVAELEVECAALRIEVEAFARKHPDHPPPPEYRGSLWTVAVPVVLTLAALIAVGLLASSL